MFVLLLRKNCAQVKRKMIWSFDQEQWVPISNFYFRPRSAVDSTQWDLAISCSPCIQHMSSYIFLFMILCFVPLTRMFKAYKDVSIHSEIGHMKITQWIIVPSEITFTIYMRQTLNSMPWSFERCWLLWCDIWIELHSSSMPRKRCSRRSIASSWMWIQSRHPSCMLCHWFSLVASRSSLTRPVA